MSDTDSKIRREVNEICECGKRFGDHRIDGACPLAYDRAAQCMLFSVLNRFKSAKRDDETGSIEIGGPTACTICGVTCEVHPKNHAWTQADPINHPPHYTSDPSGVECITITRHRNFNVGNAIKYAWRAGLKGDLHLNQIEDLKKARWYLADEIRRLGGDPDK